MRSLVFAAAFAVASQLSLTARADQEDNFVYMPAPGAESLRVDNPLGKLELHGWDKPEVRIHAIKRARNGATLDTVKVNVVMADGKIVVKAGVLLNHDPELSSLPVQSVGVDLEIYAPKGVRLIATTWSGDVRASGFRAGAELFSSGGEVYANDIEGPVRSQTIKGRQRLEAIHGDVEAGGVSGDLEFVRVDGDVLDARAVDGQVTAREVTAQVVKLFSAAGAVVYIGTLRTGGRYELSSEDGNVRLELKRVPFTVEARASGRVRSEFVLRGEVAPNRARADFLDGGPQLVLSAAHGDVLLGRLK